MEVTQVLEFLASLFVFGSWTFWFTMLLAFVFITVMVEGARDFAAFITFFIVASITAWLNHISPLQLVTENLGATIGLAVFYLLSGAVWSLVKWWRLVVTFKEVYLEVKKELAKANPEENDAYFRQLSYNLRLRFLEPDLRKYYGLTEFDGHTGGRDVLGLHNVLGGHDDTDGLNFTPKPPDPAKFKPFILRWLMFWPWSLSWTLLDDPIRRTFKAIYDSLVSTYERIAKEVFADVK